MTHMKTTFLQFTCSAVLLWTCSAMCGAKAAAQDVWIDEHEHELEVAVDGMAMPPIAYELAPPRLLGPQIEAHHIMLPVTVMPEDERRRLHLRAADLNGDGVIDALDLVEMMQRFGPCPEDEVCPDFNGDGIVDEQDLIKMLEYLGSVVSTNDATSRVQIGYVEDAPAVVRGPLPRFQLDDELVVSRLELTSPDAGGLRIEIENMFSGSVEVRVYDPNGETVLGPYFADRADEEGRFWTPTIFGTTIGVELVFDEQVDGDLTPAISRIAYIYAGGDCLDCATGPGTPLACHNCIACSSSWQNADGRAVGQISWLSGGGCFRCTGALLNRGPGDFSPLFMTANHCISTQAEANTLEVRWLYETTTCPCGGVPGFNDVPRNNGSRLLKRRSSVDWTLLGLYDPPNITGGAFFLGWLSSNWTSGQSATGIHHPRTSHKRISFGTSGGTVNGALFCDSNGTISCNCPDSNNWCIEVDVRNVDYFSGTTEPGSSGSPIFDPNRRVRGTLTGGPGGCAPVVARYGRFDLAYTNLRYFLGNESIASPVVFVNGGFSGDPGNNGNLERGTLTNPFNQVHEASYAVISGETLSIAPGNYNESMRIWRPMVITRTRSSGSVVIGSP
jgi:hypothetical protein